MCELAGPLSSAMTFGQSPKRFEKGVSLANLYKTKAIQDGHTGYVESVMARLV